MDSFGKPEILEQVVASRNITKDNIQARIQRTKGITVGFDKALHSPLEYRHSSTITVEHKLEGRLIW